jgi:hypothetical protein
VPVVEYKGIGHDTTYVSEDPREFFLVIDSSGLDWTVDVEEGVAGLKPAGVAR